MIHNKTIDAQLNHRSIRKFKDTTLNKEQLETLYSVFCTNSNEYVHAKC